MEYIGASINGNIINNLRFAYDIDLIPRQLCDLQHLLNKVEEVSTRYGLEISETKLEWLVMRHEDSINTSEKKTNIERKALEEIRSVSLPRCYNNKQ